MNQLNTGLPLKVQAPNNTPEVNNTNNMSKSTDNKFADNLATEKAQQSEHAERTNHQQNNDKGVEQQAKSDTDNSNRDVRQSDDATSDNTDDTTKRESMDNENAETNESAQQHAEVEQESEVDVSDVVLEDPNYALLNIVQTELKPGQTQTLELGQAANDTKNIVAQLATKPETVQQQAEVHDDGTQDLLKHITQSLVDQQKTAPNNTNVTTQLKENADPLNKIMNAGADIAKASAEVAKEINKDLPITQQVTQTASQSNTEQSSMTLNMQKQFSEMIALNQATNNSTQTQNISLNSFAQTNVNDLSQLMGQSLKPGTAVPVLNHTTAFGQPAWNSGFVNKVSFMLNSSIPSAEIQLHPPELGSINAKIRIENNTADLVFNAQHGNVKEAIENNLPRLRELLEQSGLSLGDVSVSHKQGEQLQQNDSQKQQGGDNEADVEDLATPAQVSQTSTLTGIIDYYA